MEPTFSVYICHGFSGKVWKIFPKLFCYVLESLSDLSLDLFAKFYVVSKECLDCFASLSKLAVAIAEP